MSFPSRPIIEGMITEHSSSFLSRWTNAENASPIDFQKDALKYFYKNYADGNFGNSQVVNTFFHQHSTSLFTFLTLHTNRKCYDIQVYLKDNMQDNPRAKLTLNPENSGKLVIKTSIAFSSPPTLERVSESKVSVCFTPKDSVSRVYSYSMAENSHDPMLRAFFNSNYTFASTYVGGCENHYRVTQTGKEGMITQGVPPFSKRQIWTIK